MIEIIIIMICLMDSSTHALEGKGYLPQKYSSPFLPPIDRTEPKKQKRVIKVSKPQQSFLNLLPPISEEELLEPIEQKRIIKVVKSQIPLPSLPSIFEKKSLEPMGQERNIVAPPKKRYLSIPPVISFPLEERITPLSNDILHSLNQKIPTPEDRTRVSTLLGFHCPKAREAILAVVDKSLPHRMIDPSEYVASIKSLCRIENYKELPELDRLAERISKRHSAYYHVWTMIFLSNLTPKNRREIIETVISFMGEGYYTFDYWRTFHQFIPSFKNVPPDHDYLYVMKNLVNIPREKIPLLKSYTYIIFPAGSVHIKASILSMLSALEENNVIDFTKQCLRFFTPPMDEDLIEQICKKISRERSYPDKLRLLQSLKLIKKMEKIEDMNLKNYLSENKLEEISLRNFLKHKDHSQ